AAARTSAPIALASSALAAIALASSAAHPAEARPSGAATTKPKSSPSAPAIAPSTDRPDDDLGHRRQFSFRAEFVTGYQMLFRYDKSPRCAVFDRAKSASDQQKFCGFGASPAIGLALGFSPLDFFEPFAFIRMGLADDGVRTSQGKMLQVGAGARLYTMSDSAFKIYFSPWLGVDTTSGPVDPANADDKAAGVVPASFRTDLLAHLDVGPQFDFSKYMGVYVSGGLTFQMLRYLGASADLGIGIQMRAP
ncbi:MAG TPA: hypothetical protein VJT73_07360, partial [Polyangiaceae bacterium]|nr:hypothetical protein [Polyangiaceae bacterium]